jgi:hypothetical protein
MSEKDFYKTELDSAATRSVQRYFYGSNSIEIKIVIYPAGKSRFDYKCDKSRVKERKEDESLLFNRRSILDYM